MDVLPYPNAGFDFLRRDHATVAGDGAHLYAADHRRGSVLVPDQVGIVARDHFVAAAAVGEDGELIAEHAGGYEQGRFLAEQVGGQLLQLDDRGVVAVNVVADLG